MNSPVNPLKKEHVAVFLSEFWQKKPLLIRQAIEDFTSPLSPDELAGLACETEVNARLLIEHINASGDQTPWSVEYGPFGENRFAELPETHWSLLVSDVEKHVPEAAAIIEYFRFIPDWRIDDLMISYAPDGGSVGPHTDAYDVFLLQIHGQRRWQISENYDKTLLNNTELSILENFSSEQEWILNPGDILYLPPEVAHHGVAQNDCMTASIGFRAPAINAMIHDFSDSIASSINDTALYSDPDLKPQAHPAEITADAIEKIKCILEEKLSPKKNSVQRWFGEYCSDKKAQAINENNEPLDSFAKLTEILETHRLHQAVESSFLFSRTGEGALLFVDGKSYEVSVEVAEIICHQDINAEALLKHSNKNTRKLLLQLYRQGSLVIEV